MAETYNNDLRVDFIRFSSEEARIPHNFDNKHGSSNNFYTKLEKPAKEEKQEETKPEFMDRTEELSAYLDSLAIINMAKLTKTIKSMPLREKRKQPNKYIYCKPFAA